MKKKIPCNITLFKCVIYRYRKKNPIDVHAQKVFFQGPKPRYGVMEYIAIQKERFSEVIVFSQRIQAMMMHCTWMTREAGVASTVVSGRTCSEDCSTLMPSKQRTPVATRLSNDKNFNNTYHLYVLQQK